MHYWVRQCFRITLNIFTTNRVSRYTISHEGCCRSNNGLRWRLFYHIGVCDIIYIYIYTEHDNCMVFCNMYYCVPSLCTRTYHASSVADVLPYIRVIRTYECTTYNRGRGYHRGYRRGGVRISRMKNRLSERQRWERVSERESIGDGTGRLNSTGEEGQDLHDKIDRHRPEIDEIKTTVLR